MAMSADELVKHEIFENLSDISEYQIRVFMQSSNLDQELFSQGGLTFGVNGMKYGSCDVAWETDSPWIDPFNGEKCSVTPAIALEATDALNRKSGGNAQYQRFHHALGAVRGGVVGIYYLRPGVAAIRPELYGMASFASKMESGTYLVTDNLDDVRTLLETQFQSPEWESAILKLAGRQQELFDDWFLDTYGDWESFAARRSTILKPGIAIKHAGRMVRNFTESSQRAGHIAVGEMYLTKYFFGKDREILYFFPRMTKADFDYVDDAKSTDKEWRLLRDEPGVTLVSIDDFDGVPPEIYKGLRALKNEPLKGKPLVVYNELVGRLEALIVSGEVTHRAKTS